MQPDWLTPSQWPANVPNSTLFDIIYGRRSTVLLFTDHVLLHINSVICIHHYGLAVESGLLITYSGHGKGAISSIDALNNKNRFTRATNISQNRDHLNMGGRWHLPILLLFCRDTKRARHFARLRCKLKYKLRFKVLMLLKHLRRQWVFTSKRS